MGYSLGSSIAEQFTMMYPDKVNSLILVVSSYGGKEGIPKPPEFKKLQADIVNKSLINIPISLEEMKALSSALLASGWIKLHTESLNIPANVIFQQMKPGLPPATMNNQNNAVATTMNNALEQTIITTLRMQML